MTSSTPFNPLQGAEQLAVRPALLSEVPRIMELIAHSRSIMRQNGNHSQWDGYPTADTIADDIRQGIGHVIESNQLAVGYFALLRTPEPTYAYIEDGRWLDDTTPYGTIHRLCCAPGVHGIARQAFAFSETLFPSIRVDTHRDNAIMLHLFERLGYCRCGVVYMRDGSPRYAFQKMMYPLVNPELKAYVEREILPRYNHFDSAHRLDHILTVMAQSMELARHYPELNLDMVYTIAAYHDTGIVEGRERHHLVSGRIVRQDPQLPQWFSPEQIETMAQAVEDHRASSSSEPRSLYGKIVAEADRDIQPLKIIRRTVQYGLDHYPQLDLEGHFQRTLQHLNEKYGRNGYLKLYIPFSRNRAQMEQLWHLMEQPALLRETFERIYLQETRLSRQ